MAGELERTPHSDPLALVIELRDGIDKAYPVYKQKSMKPEGNAIRELQVALNVLAKFYSGGRDELDQKKDEDTTGFLRRMAKYYYDKSDVSQVPNNDVDTSESVLEVGKHREANIKFFQFIHALRIHHLIADGCTDVDVLLRRVRYGDIAGLLDPDPAKSGENMGE